MKLASLVKKIFNSRNVIKKVFDQTWGGSKSDELIKQLAEKILKKRDYVEIGEDKIR